MNLLEALPTVIGTAAIAPALLILWLVVAAGERPGPPLKVWTAFLLGAASISLLGAIRAPQPGAPFAYVTTRKFLEAFGFASLRDLPDIERLKAEGLLQGGQGEDDFDSALGLANEEDQDERAFAENVELDGADEL